MAYCRWSSDNFRCDVYVYEDISGGWTTHVASYRLIGNPEPRPVGGTAENYLAWHKRNYQPIGLPHDGKSFNDPTPGDCADRLEAMRKLGYLVSQWAIERLRAEQGESNAA